MAQEIVEDTFVEIKNDEDVVKDEHQKNDSVLEEIQDTEVIGKYTGTCKWFSDLLGFGFLTICNGDDKGKDIFVHHSGIKPLNSIYKTLKKGEYINFNIINGLNGLQAVDVTGINGGPLMCDHVTGKKAFVNGDMPPPNHHQVPFPQQNMGPPSNNTQWHKVSYKKPPNAPPVQGDRRQTSLPPRPSSAVAQGPPPGRRERPKRFPPNTRPYKNKPKATNA